MADNHQPPGGGPNNRKPRGPDDRFDWKRAARTLSFWIILILVVVVLSNRLNPSSEQADVISYDEYLQLLDKGAIESAEVTDRTFEGTLKPSEDLPRRKFRVILPYVNQEMVDAWQMAGVKVQFREESPNWFGMILTSILPWLILIVFWVYIMRRMQGGGTKGIFSFGKSRAKLLVENKPKITFDDVAGCDEAKEELQEIIQFLEDPKKFQRLGGRIPKGALLIGPPGTGKTLLARAVAGEAGVPFFSMSGADFVEMFVGVGASRVRDLFDQGKKSAPCIIFIDEIDAVGRQRGAGLGGGHDEREQTLNQLLVEMDGFESNEGVILLAATNRPDVLDPALLRPGRFDRQIVVDSPDVRGREGILRVHSKSVPLADDVDLKVLAKGTPGLAGADLANLVNEAALLAARRDADKVTMEDFENAKDKVMMGTERRSLLISDEEKKLTAYHEAGHVLVAKYTSGSDPVHKVTIIPRGRALGLTHYLPIDEKHSWSKKYIEGKLIHLLGGRAAERLVFDDYTNGAATDIKQATDIARKMVCDWGMSEKIGPLALGKREEEVFLGREIATHRDFSDATALEIDREVKRIVMNAQKIALDLLQEHMEQLHRLAGALLEREILDGEEIDLVIQGKKLPPAHQKRTDGKRVGSARRGPRRQKAMKPVAVPAAARGSSDTSIRSRREKVEEVLAKLDAGQQEASEPGAEGASGDAGGKPRRRTVSPKSGDGRTRAGATSTGEAPSGPEGDGARPAARRRTPPKTRARRKDKSSGEGGAA